MAVLCCYCRNRLAAISGVKRAGEVDPIETQDEIGIGNQLGAAAMQRMVGRKRRAGFAVGHHLRADRFG